MVKRQKISGEKIARLRDHLHLTQEEMAPKLGLTASGLRRIERLPAVGIYPRTLRSLAVLMGVTANEAAEQLAAEGEAVPRVVIEGELAEALLGMAAAKGVPVEEYVRQAHAEYVQAADAAEWGPGEIPDAPPRRPKNGSTGVIEVHEPHPVAPAAPSSGPKSSGRTSGTGSKRGRKSE